MKNIIILFLTLFCVMASAQNKMSLVNLGIEEDIRIIVPNKSNITSGYEKEGELVITDTIYADDYCFIDTAEYNVVEVESLISCDSLYRLANRYRSVGKYFEMVISLYQSWLMNNMDEVDAFINQHEDVKMALSFMIFKDNLPNTNKEKSLKYLENLHIANDKEICVFNDFLKLGMTSSNPLASLKVFRTEANKNYKDNDFYKYIDALIEYDDNGKYKSNIQKFEKMMDVADLGIELAYTDIAKDYAKGYGTDKDIEKAQLYFLKAINAGLLDNSAAREYLILLNENPDILISNSLKEHLIKTCHISLSYWLSIQKHINNL